MMHATPPLAPATAPSEAGIFLHLLWQTMQQMGLDTATIFNSINLPDTSPDPDTRRDNGPQRRFWRAVEQVSGDADIGLHVGARLPSFRGHVLEYLFLSSPTFGAGLARSLRYSGLLTGTFQLTLRVEDKIAYLSGFSHPVRHFLECSLVVVLRLLVQVSEGAFRPQMIWLEHTQGAAPETYQQVYGCQVQLGANEGAILFDAALLDQPSPAAQPQLLQLHETLAQQQLADLQKHQIVGRVEKELGGLLESGNLSLAAVAARLALSERSLRTELAACGTGFNDVVTAYRERLARRLLAHTQESLDQIIYLTGFSEPAAFSRAFKRWTGETPTAYRRRKQST